MILSEQQALVRDTARSFSTEKLAPFAAERERSGIFPKDAMAEAASLGFCGMLVPEEWGGAALDHVSYAAALEEIAVGDGGLAGALSVQNSVVCMPLVHFGTEDQKERWLKPLARGEMMGGFCLTEPQAGSDASNLRTRARREGNGYRLSGTKQFVTMGATAGMVIVFAVTNPDAGKRGISAFLVPKDAKGVEVARVEDKMGQRHIDAAQLVFDEVPLPGESLLGKEGEGYKIALANLEGGRIGIASQALGIARAAFEAARRYAKEREAFGKKLAALQAVLFKLADMATEIEAARLMIHHAAELRDARRPCLKEASMAKLFASEMAERVCSEAIQIHGGYGYLEDYPVARYARDVRVCKIYEGASDIQRLVIGRAVLEESES
ncbi:MAG: acyl-CoA dehydrogenase family protein [Alphaproteobacteria bacterium]|nr:acyl-CoA dehydrogenase family protein [Alphaproteobacteria bacterium]